MFTVWHVDKYKITFKLVINSRRISRSPVYLMPGPGTGRGPVVEKHWSRPTPGFTQPHTVDFSCDFLELISPLHLAPKVITHIAVPLSFHTTLCYGS